MRGGLHRPPPITIFGGLSSQSEDGLQRPQPIAIFGRFSDQLVTASPNDLDQSATTSDDLDQTVTIPQNDLDQSVTVSSDLDQSMRASREP